MGALSIRQVRKSYGAHEILKSIDIDVEQGEFLILVGPSGCGKSTLLSMIAGLDTPTSGQILLGDRDITHASPKDRDIAMVFQSYALYPNMTVAQNITFGLEMRKVPKAQREEAIARVAKMLQIEHLLDRRPAQLSGGQRQRVAMGRALARNPSLFLFDEPLSNLDAKLRVEMRAEIKLLHQRTRTTTVYVTHDQVEAMTLGDRIAVMREGVLQQLGTPDDIYTRPATIFVAQFIGSPAMNLVQAQWMGGTLSMQGTALPLSEAAGRALAARNPASVVYGLRPEALRLSDRGLPGQLRMVEPTGPETYAYVDTAVGPMVLRVPGRVAQPVGSNVLLDWNEAEVHLFDGQSEQRIEVAAPSAGAKVTPLYAQGA
ncbi:ABC transporter ATP-binding protein [Ideonella dechloratans]|uniref:ABC transporter ATP-binding protein n=1 Tax=Ideonella dechloratans TaxID=36863 RepID=UPI0035B2EAE6